MDRITYWASRITCLLTGHQWAGRVCTRVACRGLTTSRSEPCNCDDIPLPMPCWHPRNHEGDDE